MALVEQEFVERKLDSQLCSIENFRNLFQIREDEHIKLQTKHVSTKDAWDKLHQSSWIHGNDIRLYLAFKFKWWWIRINALVPKQSFHWITIVPTTIVFFRFGGWNHLDYPCILSILFCPFCHRLFELAWDCKFSSCKHVYHS